MDAKPVPNSTGWPATRNTSSASREYGSILSSDPVMRSTGVRVWSLLADGLCPFTYLHASWPEVSHGLGEGEVRCGPRCAPAHVDAACGEAEAGVEQERGEEHPAVGEADGVDAIRVDHMSRLVQYVTDHFLHTRGED